MVQGDQGLHLTFQQQPENNSALGCGESVSCAHEICWVRESQVTQTDHINPKMKQRSFLPPSFSPAVINHRNNEASACPIQVSADTSGKDFCDWRSFVPSILKTPKVYEKHQFARLSSLAQHQYLGKFLVCPPHSHPLCLSVPPAPCVLSVGTSQGPGYGSATDWVMPLTPTTITLSSVTYIWSWFF